MGTMSAGRSEAFDDSDLGGEAPCYAHLFEDAGDTADTGDAEETADAAHERASDG
jgi:hypothetical protein